MPKVYIKKGRNKGPRNKERAAEIYRLYEEGMLTIRQIGQLFGVSGQRVQQILGKAGFKKRPHITTIHIESALLRKLYVEERNSITATAAKLGVGTNVVRRELDRHGIPCRGHNPIRIAREIIERLYVTDGLTQIQAAKKIGVRVSVFQRELRRHGITLRHTRTYERHPRIERELLEHLYTEGLTLVEIGKKVGLSSVSVSKYMRRYGLPTRRSPVPRLTDRALVERLYVDELLSMRAVAEKLGTTLSIVYGALRRYGIPRRRGQGPGPTLTDREMLEHLYLNESLTGRQIAENLGTTEKAVYRALHRLGIPVRAPRNRIPILSDPELLQRLYVDQGLGAPEIGRRLGTGPKAVLAALRRNGIPVRPRGVRGKALG